MGVTGFLSMWINNSAATSIMMPAAIAICDEGEKYHIQRLENYEVLESDHNSKDTTSNNVTRKE